MNRDVRHPDVKGARPMRRYPMPWSNQGGGPWGSGGKSPWGSGQQPSGGSTPPDLEEFLRRSQDRLRTVLPGGNFGSKGAMLALLGAVLIWGLSGFCSVD